MLQIFIENSLQNVLAKEYLQVIICKNFDIFIWIEDLPMSGH